MNVIGILIVFGSVGYVYSNADFYKARTPNGPSTDIENHFVYSGDVGYVHSTRKLEVNTDSLSIVSNFEDVDDESILEMSEWERSTSYDSYGREGYNARVEMRPNFEICQKIIRTFFSNCEDCNTHLDYVKYILLYVVYARETSTCVRSYINYIYNAVEVKEYGGFLSINKDPLRVISPQYFCDQLTADSTKNKHYVSNACIKQMKTYFGRDFNLNNEEMALNKIFYEFDFSHIKIQADSGYIQGYIKHVKNRFYYNASRDKLLRGETIQMFCEYRRIITPSNQTAPTSANN